MKQILLISALIFCGNLPVCTQWIQTNGPEGGRVTCLTENGTQIFAGTDGGGVYRSSDNGITWNACNKGLTGEEVMSLAARGSYLFVGTNHGIFRSKDNGKTWIVFNDSIPDIQANEFAFIDSMVFVGTYWQGVFETTFNGEHWTRIEGKSGSPNVKALIVKDNTLYVQHGDSIYRSTDEGLHWNECQKNDSIPNMDVTHYAFSGGVTLETSRYGATGDIIRSNDGTKTWKELSSRGLRGNYTNCLCAHNTMFFVGTDNGVFCSRDSGTSWSRCSTGFFCAKVRSVAIRGNTLLASETQGFFRSTDNGVTWLLAKPVQSQTGWRMFDQWGIFIGSIGHDIYFSAYPSGIYRSTDDGITWYSLILPSVQGYTDEPFSSCISDNHIIFATIEGIFSSSDASETWSHVLVADWKGHRPKLASDGKNVIAGIDGVGFFRSTDKGKHWKKIQAGDMMKKYLDNVAIHGNYLYAIMYGDRGWNEEFPTHYLYRSQDKGKHWKVVSPVKRGVNSFTQFLFIRQILFKCDGRISYSKDGGENWINITVGLMDNVSSITFNKHDVFVGTTGSGVWRRPINEIIKSY